MRTSDKQLRCLHKADIRRMAMFVALLGLLLLGGCYTPEVQVINDRDPIIDQDVRKTAQASNRIGDQLYMELAQTEGNLFFSPASVSAAMSMTLRGASATTADEIKNALNIELDESAHHAANGEFVRLMNLQGKGFEIRLANRLWGQEGIGFAEDFLNAMLNDYRAPFGQVDFQKDSEAARQEINQWVSQLTNGRIKELFESGVLNTETVLVLANAIYFKADWRTPFSKRDTADDNFRLDANNEIQVPMMRRVGKMQFAETKLAMLLQLPYTNSEFTMTIVLPKVFGTLNLVESNWLAPDSAISQQKFYERDVTVHLPRFKFESEFRLDETIKKLGIVQAFTPYADFSRICEDEDLFIDAVVHKAFVEFNEEGTEAAAATGVAIAKTAISVDGPVEFIVDQPFLFKISHEPSGLVLFAGRVVDPR